MIFVGLCSLLIPSLISSFENSGSHLVILIAVTIAIYFGYVIIIAYFGYLMTTNELIVHMHGRPCINRENCRFKSRYRKQRLERTFRFFMGAKESQQFAKNHYRASDVLLKPITQKKSLKSKNQGKTSERVPGSFTDGNTCYICAERPVGAAMLPCMHTGICVQCALQLMKPRSQGLFHFKSKGDLKCPMCKEVPEKLFFFEEKEDGRLRGIGYQEVISDVLKISQKEFEESYLVDS